MLGDADQIRNLQARYCRGVDRRDRTLVAACFHPDATDDHGSGVRTLGDFLDWCFELLSRYDSTFHLLGQTLIVPTNADTVTTETYGIAHHHCAGGSDHLNLTTGFRYLDRIERRDGTWRIATRRAVTDWSRVEREADRWDVDPRMLRGTPGPDDPSYDAFT